MASMKERIENGQAFDRLVNRRYQNSMASGIPVRQINDIEKRATTIIGKQREHYKRNFDQFVDQETYRQLILRIAAKATDGAPAVSKKDFEQCRNVAKRIVNDRYRMKILKIDQASERMQLRAISIQRQVSDVTKAYRVKERGASLANRLKAHHRKHFKAFVDKQAQKDKDAYDKSFRQRFKSERSVISVPKLEQLRMQSEAKVVERHERRLERVKRTTQTMHQNKIKQAKQTHQQRM